MASASQMDCTITFYSAELCGLISVFGTCPLSGQALHQSVSYLCISERKKYDSIDIRDGHFTLSLRRSLEKGDVLSFPLSSASREKDDLVMTVVRTA